MKVRIGYGIGTQGLADGGARFAELIDSLEALGFDSIWCSERATGPIPTSGRLRNWRAPSGYSSS